MNKRKRSRKIATLLFVMTLLVIAGIFAASVFLTDRYNRRVHQYTGTQFDPKIADIFLKLIKEGKI